MFVIWLWCILQVFILIKCQITSNIGPQYKLKISMQQVGDLLADIDAKITKERKLLAKLADNPTLKVQNMTAWLETMAEKIDNMQEDNQQTGLENLYVFRNQFANLTKQRGAKNLRKALLQSKNDSKVKTNWLADKDDNIYIVPTQNTAKETVTIEPSPFESKLKNLMLEQHVGYCYAALSGITDIIVDNDDHEFKMLLKALVKTIVRMSTYGKLDSLGDAFANRVRLLKVWTSISSVAEMIYNMQKLQQAFRQKHTMDDDALQILTLYDTFFTVDEGKKILDKVTQLRDSEILGDSATVQLLMENLIEALVAPANRKLYSSELERLNAMTNKAYLKRYPDFRRSEVDDLIDTINAVETTASFESIVPRRMGFKGLKFEFKKVLRHLIKKHPKLLKKFIEHFKHNERHKHRHTKNKRRQKSHHKKHHRTINHKHNSEKTPSTKTTKVITNKLDSTTTEGTPKFRESSRQTTSNTFADFQLQKRYSVVPVIPWYHKRISPSILTRRLLKDDITDTKFSKYNTRYTESTIKKSLNAKKVHHRNKPRNKTVLQTIMEESSYSDQEPYFKTKLNDALDQWNGTIGNNLDDEH